MVSISSPASKRPAKAVWLRCVLVLYLILLCGRGIAAYTEIVQLLSRGQLFALEANGHPYISDFVGWYSCAQLAKRAHSEGINIYDEKVQDESFRQLVAPVVPEATLYQPYPPYFFALVKPLANFSLTDAWKIWCLLGLLSTFISLYCLAAGKFQSWFPRLFFGFSVFCSFPCCLSFRAGQTSFFLLLGLTIFWYCLFRRKFLAAGLSCALCLIKVQYFPIVFLTGLLLGKMRYCLGLAISALLLLFISWLSVGSANVLAFPQAAWQAEIHPHFSIVVPEMMQNVRGLMFLLFHQDTSWGWGVTILVFLAACAAVGWMWLKLGQRAYDPKFFYPAAAISTLTLLVVSPHTHIQDYLAVAIAASFLWLRLQNANEPTADILKWLIIAFAGLSWVFYVWLPTLFIPLGWPPFFLWAAVVIGLTARACFVNKTD